MNERLKDLKIKQLDWIIQSDTLVEEVKNTNYYLLEYLFNSLIIENYHDEELKEIIEALEKSFEFAKKNGLLFIYNYIDSLSKSISNNDIINEFINNKEYNEIIYNLLITCRSYNIYNIKEQQKYIRVTIDEIKTRKEFFNKFFKPYSGCSPLESLMKTDFIYYLVTNKSKDFNLDNYKRDLETFGRKRYICYILGTKSSDNISNNYYYKLSSYPFKPKVEGELKTYLLSLLMDGFYTYKSDNNPIETSIEILHLEEKQIESCRELLKYSIDEKTLDQIRKTYNNLCNYRKNNELLSILGIEPFYQNKDNISELKTYENHMCYLLEESDMLPLSNINYKQMSTKMKKNIQDIWDTKMHRTIYPLFLCWLINYEELFSELYEKNKINFMNIINDYINSNKDSEEEIYIKLKQIIDDTTNKYLEENEESLYKNINKETLKKLSINSQAEKELALYNLKYLLAGISQNKYKDEIEQEVCFNFQEMDIEDLKRVINDMYEISDDYLAKKSDFLYYNNIRIYPDKKRNDFSYISLLERNVNLLKDLKKLTEEMILADQIKYFYLHDTKALYVQAHISEVLNIDLYNKSDNIFEDLEDKLSVIEEEQEKYEFFKFINNYLQIIGATDEQSDIVKNQLIKCFYNEYSKIMNNLPEYDYNLINYITLETKKYIHREIINKNNLNYMYLLDNFKNLLINLYNEYFKENNTNKSLYKSKI